MNVGTVEKARTVDPILNIPVHSSVTSLCFVSRKNPAVSFVPCDGQSMKLRSDDDHTESVDGIDSSSQSSEEYDDDDDDGEIKFRSSTIRFNQPDSASFRNHPRRVLNDRFMASCHSDGEALLWDLNNQKKVATISPPRGGSGLCIGRTEDPTQIMFQTRDPKGIVSLHSIERCDIGGNGNSTSTSSVVRTSTATTTTRQYETYSQTFCQATPCHGNRHLFALPSIDDSTVTLVDDRTDTNVAKYSIDGHGMLTSLALTVTANDTGHYTGRPILACGMESGTAVFFDITTGSRRSSSEASFSLGKDPILTIDVLPSRAVSSKVSSLPTNSSSNEILVAAGMAGDAEDVSQLSNDEIGRAVLFKTIYCQDNHNTATWNFEQRARLSTCRVDRKSFNGKPGISICRFRPKDGRLLAIGGWDRRIRLFERSKGNLMAILKGNAGSIADLDWAPDSMTSGLFASANKDDKLITLWQCFGKS